MPKIFECLACREPCHSAWPLCVSCSRKFGEALHAKGVFADPIVGVPVIAFGDYAGSFARLLKVAKAQPCGFLSERFEFLFRSLIEHWREELADFGAEAVVCIPSHPIRCFGETDLSRFLACEISRALKIPVLTKALQFRMSSVWAGVAPQKGLSRGQRLDPRRANRFRVPERGTSRVLLVDDISTTGGSLAAGIHLLEGAGYLVSGCTVFAQSPSPRSLAGSPFFG